MKSIFYQILIPISLSFIFLLAVTTGFALAIQPPTITEFPKPEFSREQISASRSVSLQRKLYIFEPSRVVCYYPAKLKAPVQNSDLLSRLLRKQMIYSDSIQE